MKQNVTIFEVLDNYFGSNEPPDVYKLNGGKIRVLREHIIEFYNVNSFPPPEDFKTRLFLGGFLSSPPLVMEATPYMSSALLLSDSLILFDPLHYWFCDEQYSRERLLSAPSGWLDRNSGQPNYPLTRRYLEQAFNWLYQVRSLIEKGIIILIPAERLVSIEQAKINQLSIGINYLLDPIENLAKEYLPEEITVDDNRKGLFVFTDGIRADQINKSIGRGINQFAKDIIIANASGAIYTSPFKWEQKLGQKTLNEFSEAAYHTSIIEVVRKLRLPILSNLSPNVLESIHEDSSYTEFRLGLSKMLQAVDAEIGSPDFNTRVAKIEIDILVPKVQALYKEIQSSKFTSATKATMEGLFTFAQGFIGNVFVGMDFEMNLQFSEAVESLSFLHELFKTVSKSTERRIWAQLLPENVSMSTYFRGPLTLNKQGEAHWDLDEVPTGRITTSKGLIKPPLIFD
jgi:hypothetical protein